MTTRPEELPETPRTINRHRRRTSVWGRCLAIVGALALAGGGAWAGVGVSSADAASSITRAEVMKRAKTWSSNPVPYSMSRTRGGYRTDCSGFVSMAWKIGKPGLSTVTLVDIAKRIDKQNLKAGDIIMKGGPGTGGANGHVVIFEKWANQAKTAYVGIEQTPPQTKRREIPYPYFNGGSGYRPYRYSKIVDDKPKPEPTKPKPTATKPSPTATKPEPSSSQTVEPTAPGGGGQGDEPSLPKTGAPALLVAGLGGALLLGGGALLIVGRRRGRFRTQR